MPLIDPYEAFQLLDDEWTLISGDLEILQTEGFGAVRAVDPNMVLKKKEGKDQELQEGWRGRILPFELVQRTLMQAETAQLADAQSRLDGIDAELSELLESISEEDKNSDETNEGGDSFVPAAVLKKAKELIAARKKGTHYDADSYEAIIIKSEDAESTDKKRI